jgi:hypothetical protein
VEGARRFAFAVGAVHRHRPPQLDVTETYARANKRSFKGEAATKQKRHKIVAPEIEQIVDLALERALTVDAIARDVKAQVSAWR